MRKHLATSDRLRGADEEGFFWAIASDTGDMGGGPQIVLFRDASGRSGAFAEQFQRGFKAMRRL